MVNESIARNVSATAGNVATDQVPFLGSLSWQAVVVIAIIAFALILIVAIAFFRPRQRKAKATSPFFKSLFLTLIVLFCVIIVEAMGWFGPDGLPVEWKVVGTFLFFVCLMIIFKDLNKAFDERVKKVFPERIREHQKSHYQARLNVGESSGSQVPHHIVLPNNGYGGKDDSVVHYLAFNSRNHFYHYVFGLDSGIILQATEDPAPEVVWNIFKKKVVPINPQIEFHKPSDEGVARISPPVPQNA